MKNASSTLDLSGSVAIIGMSCRFPGAKNVKEFWKNLRDGIESITYFSDDELIENGCAQELLKDSNFVKAGFVIDDIEAFDASFFEYSPKEAQIMDPQQRIFLECAWEALEDSGYPPNNSGETIGVFAGAKMSTYQFNINGNGNNGGVVERFQRLTGNDKDYLTSRISYKLNLKGPSVTIQSACSTSLVAVHFACESLLNGNCDMALAGGVAIMVPQKMGYLYQEGMIFSPDGHCRPFDINGKGMVGGNGVGIVVLKRLDDAIKDGDNITAVIRGSAVNNDGSLKVGYTAPSVEGQSEVIREAIAIAGVEAESISYIETHGTGTSLGDPVEIAALSRVFRAETEKKGFCAIGSVKSNIGHLDTAAGVASLIKAALSIKHKLMPPSLNFEEPNPQIDFAGSPFFVNSRLSEWKCNKYPRRAGVSSFGFGGTNAHVVLEQAPEVQHKNRDSKNVFNILTLSAKSKDALNSLVDKYNIFLTDKNDYTIDDICYTANSGRSHFRYRMAFIAESLEHLKKQINDFVNYDKPAGLKSGIVSGDTSPGVVFLFTGQGSRNRMAVRELYDSQSVFRNILNNCNEILRNNHDISILPEILEDKEDLSPGDGVIYSQSALFALEYSISSMLLSWRIEPVAVMGCGIGEFAAACIAGVFSLADGLKLAAARDKLTESLSDFEMFTVSAGENEISEKISSFRDEVFISAVNEPGNVVITGTEKGMKEALEQLSSDVINCKRINSANRYNSPMTIPMASDFEKAAAEINYKDPGIDLISGLTGRVAEPEEVCNAAYWSSHLLKTIRFTSGMETLYSRGHDIFIEIGPDPVLTGMGKRCLPNGYGVWLPALRKGEDELKHVLENLGELYVRGLNIDWNGFYTGQQYCRVSLPTYPFERKRYWIDRKKEAKKPVINVNTGIWDLITGYGKKASEDGIPRLNLKEYREKEQDLKRLYASYISLAFQSIGAFQGQNEKQSVDDLLMFFPILPRYKQLLPRLLDGLEKLGMIRKQGDYYENFKPVKKEEIDELLHVVSGMTLFKENPAILNFVIRCGENLGNVIVGKIDPMEVIFPAGAFDMAEEIYRNNPHSEYYNHILRDILKGASAALPENSHLRILEIGAGTGSTTASLLPVLPPDRVTYTFTDLSPIFLKRAEEKFRDYPFLKTGILDIQEKPQSQGFRSEGFDIVIASNMLHAARDMFDAINHVRSVLAPGGLLMIREITDPMLLFDISFGPLLTQLVDEKLRCGKPFLSVQKWKELLKSHGFMLSESFPEHGSPAEILEENVMVAMASSTSENGTQHAFSAPLEAASFKTDLLITGDVTPLIGMKINSPLEDIQFVNKISLSSFPYVADHKIHGAVLMPGTVFLGMALKGAEDLLGTRFPVIKELSFNNMLFIPEDGEQITVQTVFSGVDSDKKSFRIFSSKSKEHNDWTLNVSGLILSEKGNKENYTAPLAEIKKRCREALSIEQYHKETSDHGFEYGPAFQGIKNLYKGDGEALGEVELLASLKRDAKNQLMHPAMLDACLQMTGATLPCEIVNDPSVTFIDVGARAVRFFREVPEKLWCHTKLSSEQEVSANKNVAIDFTLFDYSGDIVAEICGFLIKVAGRDNLKIKKPGGNLVDNFYRVCWQKKNETHLMQHRKEEHPGIWVIFADKEGLGLTLAGKLRKNGELCVIVSSGERYELFEKSGMKHFTLDPLNPDDFVQLFIHIGKSGSLCCRGIIHMWSMDAVTENKPEESQPLICGSVLHLVQAVAAVAGDKWDKIPRLWMVTRGAQEVKEGEKLLDPAQTTLWGLSRVIANEHPELVGVVVDLDSSADTDNVYALFKELFLDGSEKEVAFRGVNRYVSRFVRLASSTSPSQEAVKLRSDATYLITGGLGGLGIALAGWLAENGVRHIALISRKGATGDALEAVEKLRSNGVNVLVYNADVTDQKEIKAALDKISSSMPHLKGVFHLSGVLDDANLTEQEWGRFSKVMGPKVAGAWNLHLLTRGFNLDYFVLFSSMASIFGTHGQANHAAANAFLDGLAFYRRSLGLKGMSLDWGVWSETGSAVNSRLNNRLALHGVEPFTVRQGLALLEHALLHDFVSAGIITIDWKKYFSLFPKGQIPLFFSELASENKKGEPFEGVDILKQLKNTTEALRPELLKRYLKQKIADTLHMDTYMIEDDNDLIQIGMDSLIFIDLSQLISRDLKIHIVAHEVFENPRIDAMAELFLKDIDIEPDDILVDPDGMVDHEFVAVIEKDKTHEPFDLMDMQQAYMVGRSGVMELGNVSCHVYTEVESDVIDLERYEKSWRRLIDRHGMLRAVFLPTGKQKILSEVPEFNIDVTDLRELGQDDRESRLMAIRHRMSHQVLDVEKWPLFEIRATQLQGTRIRLHFSLDLLIADVHSIILMMQEVMEFYHNPENQPEPLEITFRDYVLSEKEFRGSELYKKSREYWLTRLDTLPPAPDFPIVKNPCDLVKSHFVRREFKLGKKAWSFLKTRASEQGLTSSLCLLAAYAKTISRWSANLRFTISITLFNRLPVHPQVNRIIGDFTSISLLAVENCDKESFAAMAGKIRNQFWNDMEHRYFSGIEVLRELAKKSSVKAIMPVIFTSQLVYERIDQNKPERGFPGEVVYGITQTPQVWLDNQVREEDGELTVFWDSVDAIFPEGLLDDMFDAYCRLLENLAADEVRI
jgi:acyl transferase domain-containing protein/aryl carrier-like protein